MFNSVPHALLLQLLRDIELDSHIVQWIFSYLSDRKQYVVVEGTSSDICCFWSPTGICLGPIALSDSYCVGNLELSYGSRLTMYADDIRLMKPIRCFNDFIQRDIDIIANCIDNFIDDFHSIIQM